MGAERVRVRGGGEVTFVVGGGQVWLFLGGGGVGVEVVVAIVGVGVWRAVVGLVQGLVGAALVLSGVHLVDGTGPLLRAVDEGFGGVPCLGELGGTWLGRLRGGNRLNAVRGDGAGAGAVAGVAGVGARFAGGGVAEGKLGVAATGRGPGWSRHTLQVYANN